MRGMRASTDPCSIEDASRATYSSLAKEYYDNRHVTTRNFDLLIDIYLQDTFRGLATESPWLDVGCGDTRLRQLIGPDNLVLVDSSIDMLKHSFRRPESRLRAAVGSAFALPFKANSFFGVFASLGDPFTHPIYFAEARRILREGGLIVHIVPAQEWGHALRRAQCVPLDSAHFFRGASDSFAPSFLYSDVELRGLLTLSGFTEVVTRHLYLPTSLSSEVVSPDIQLSANAQAKTIYEVPILTVVKGRAR
jgi:SAM-dependent methyltransferase